MAYRKRIIQSICLILLLSLATLCLSVTYGRYRSTIEQAVSFQAKTLEETGAFRITSAKGWQTSGNGMVLDFTLSGGDASDPDCTACLRMTATEGLDPDVVISLTVDGKTYEATAYAIKEGAALYNQMGSGTEFRFSDAQGELGWKLTAAKSMRLSVQGVSDTALLRLIVQEQ